MKFDDAVIGFIGVSMLTHQLRLSAANFALAILIYSAFFSDLAIQGERRVKKRESMLHSTATIMRMLLGFSVPDSVGSRHSVGPNQPDWEQWMTFC